MSTPAISRFLWTRGLWLIVVEMTLVLFAATFNLSYRYVIWQVIWAIGWSMIALSALIFLPWKALLVFSIAMIAAHNAFDAVRPEHFSGLGWLWKVLHEGLSTIQVPGGPLVFSVYPLVPWIGVMAAGYCFGRVYDLDPVERRRFLLRAGLTLTAAFLALRAVNIYGDPSPWTVQADPMMTVLSFLRTSKYPPSLLYLLMTLGPSLIALSALERISFSDRHPLRVFGRVPLFFYVVHWYVLHLVALGFAWVRYGRFDFMFDLPPALLPPPTAYPAGYGYGLGLVYLVWMAIVVGLYPLCRWFAGVKARNRSVWLSYV